MASGGHANGHLDPAKRIILRLGGVDAVAAVTGHHRSRVFRWMYPRSRGGTGGLIPQRTIPLLLKHAKKKKIKLTAEDFIRSA
jgi:hypothetical protein